MRLFLYLMRRLRRIPASCRSPSLIISSTPSTDDICIVRSLEATSRDSQWSWETTNNTTSSNKTFLLLSRFFQVRFRETQCNRSLDSWWFWEDLWLTIQHFEWRWSANTDRNIELLTTNRAQEAIYYIVSRQSSRDCIFTMQSFRFFVFLSC